MRARYAGYVRRDRIQAQRLRRMAAVKIPTALDYQRIPGLSTEGRTKLAHRQPASFRDACAIPGVTLADLVALQLAVRAQPAPKSPAV